MAGRLSLVLAAAFAVSLAGGAQGAPDPPPYVVAYTRQAPEGTGSPLEIVRADGTDARRLTDATSFDLAAAWSPDGGRIALETIDPQRVNSSVGVVGIDGSPKVDLGRSGYDELPAWSPDGSTIAYQEETDYGSGGGRAGTSFDLWVVRPDGTGRRRVGTGGTDGSSADWVSNGEGWGWSPDSRHMAFVQPDPKRENPTSGEAASRIVLADVGTGRVVARAPLLPDADEVSSWEATEVGWAWAPNGRRLALVRPRPGSSRIPQIALVDVATDRLRAAALPAARRVANEEERPSLAQHGIGWKWSPDGRWLAVVRADAAKRLRLSVVNAATGAVWHVPVRLSNRLVNGVSLAVAGSGWRWSPDGRRLAIIRQTSGGSLELVLADVARHKLRPAGAAAVATWSPDGKRLSVSPTGAPCAVTWIVNAATTTRRPLVPARPRACWALVEWSPDATLLAFIGRRDDAIVRYTVAPDGSNMRRLPRASAADVAWPPDCRELFSYTGGWILRDSSGSPRFVEPPEIPDESYAAWRC